MASTTKDGITDVLTTRFNDLWGQFMDKMIVAFPTKAQKLNTMKVNIDVVLRFSPSILICGFLEATSQLSELFTDKGFCPSHGDQTILLEFLSSSDMFKNIGLTEIWVSADATNQKCMWSYMLALYNISAAYAQYSPTTTPTALTRSVSQDDLLAIPDDVKTELSSLLESKGVKDILSSFGVSTDISTADMQDALLKSKDLQAVLAGVGGAGGIDLQGQMKKLASLCEDTADSKTGVPDLAAIARGMGVPGEMLDSFMANGALRPEIAAMLASVVKGGGDAGPLAGFIKSIVSKPSL